MPPAQLARGGTVKLTVDPGVGVPANAVPATQQAATSSLQTAGLASRISGRCETGTPDQVIAVVPAPGTLVAKGSAVDIDQVFNTLNSIIFLTRKDAGAAERALLSFARMLRYLLDSNRGAADRVPLREELDFVRDYLDLVEASTYRGDRVRPT